MDRSYLQTLTPLLGGNVSGGGGGLGQITECTESAITSKKWSIYIHIGVVIVMGIMLAVIGGFSAKAAADLNQLSNFKESTDSTSASYNESLKNAHSYMAGAASIAWVGFAALVVTIIIVVFLITTVGTAAVAKNVTQKLATDAGSIMTEANQQLADCGGGDECKQQVCDQVAADVVRSAATTPVFIITVVNLGVTAFVLFMSSMAIRSFLSLRTLKQQTHSPEDAAKIATSYKNTQITMGLGLGAGILGVVGTFW